MKKNCWSCLLAYIGALVLFVMFLVATVGGQEWAFIVMLGVIVLGIIVGLIHLGYLMLKGDSGGYGAD